MLNRFTLLNAGLYPETLPPCFNSADAKRAFHGIVADLDRAKFRDRRSEYTRYNGTKHDGNRRLFGTPNIITYFHISSFIWKNWSHFNSKFESTQYSIGKPKLMADGSERALKVPSLSELSKHTSEKIKHSPFILRADISQCFPSIYTHSIPWAMHGISSSKADTKYNSKNIFFNELDFFVRNGQNGNTRGVLIGPDAYRIIAEFILCQLDDNINDKIKGKIVGAVRHVDDYYIGLKSEHEAQSVLSKLSECLSQYSLNINDHKTKIFSSLDPINDLWAQRLRYECKRNFMIGKFEHIERLFSESVNTSIKISSSSPIKILIRHIDDSRIYRTDNWKFIEQNLLRIIQKHPHAIDYVCLLVAKKNYADPGDVDVESWHEVAETIIKRCISFNHDHEITWLLWLLLVLKYPLNSNLIAELSNYPNEHVKSLLIQAYVDGMITRKPKISLGNSLNTSGSDWIVSLLAKSQGYSKAKFSGDYSEEFAHLAGRNIRLIDFNPHDQLLATVDSDAISHTRYGYDDDDDDDRNDELPDFDHWLEANP